MLTFSRSELYESDFILLKPDPVGRKKGTISDPVQSLRI